jgi:TolA-binding protein
MRRRGFVSVVTACITAVVFVGVLFALSVPSVSAQEGLYRKGLHAYLKKDYRNAAKYLREYTDQKPDAAAYYLLGYANYKLKNRKEAEENFREAYLLDPGFTPKSLAMKEH